MGSVKPPPEQSRQEFIILADEHIEPSAQAVLSYAGAER